MALFMPYSKLATEDEPDPLSLEEFATSSSNASRRGLSSFIQE